MSMPSMPAALARAVAVQDLTGRQLLLAAARGSELKCAVAKAWDLDMRSFRLLAGTAVLQEDTDLTCCSAEGDAPLEVQLLKFDPLPQLGRFDASSHSGIEVFESEHQGCTTLRKTQAFPDSTNVFLCHPIREPCFVEFDVVRSGDEMSFGVTYKKNMVEQISGFANLSIRDTWIYSKQKSMPAFFFGGVKKSIPGAGLLEGDRIAVYADPGEQLVSFSKNGALVASNLPDLPLPPMEEEHPLWMYAMVDQRQDEVSVIRFGPGKPYD
eukprot:gb/GFBE01013747.1/.p1 GENE.gb/GFBE01013747.1/~~gb/GFBE01013747.1/.p1  ORF type:complete len:268 (+),score=57.27 gb/GFBE01013747.1/:1-804(+)